MSSTFFPTPPGAQNSAEPPPRLFFPSAVSAPATSSDWAATEHLRQMAADRARPNRHGSSFHKEEDHAASSPSLDRSASLEEGRFGASPSKSTFSIEQPSGGAEDPQDIPLIHVQWGQNGAEIGASPSQSRRFIGAEPATPVRDHRSPAKSYPTPEPSANPYQEEPASRKWRDSWGGGLLSAPRRSRCPKPSTVFFTILILLAVLVVGLTIGHFVAPYVRTMTYLHAPAPAPGLEAVPVAGMDRSGGQDGSSIEGVGLGLQNDYPSTIPTDATPATSTKNPYLDRYRQGSGSSSLTPGTPGNQGP